MSSSEVSDNLEYEVVVGINSGIVDTSFLDKEILSGQLVAIHVNSSQYSRLHGYVIRPKSDIFFVVSHDGLLNTGKYYFNETDLINKNYTVINGSGVSVKKSRNYTTTIQKLSPAPFKNIYNYLELGAGASIYCTKSGLAKNSSILKGWGVDEEMFNNYFSYLGKDYFKIDNVDDMKLIKTEATKAIEQITNSSTEIAKMFYQGVGMFEDPYYAPWLYVDGILQPNTIKKLKVTTGSGRSKGVFQLVFKPDH